MNEEIIRDLPVAYAFHKYIEDEGGVPCDYIYLDVNKKFESYIGLGKSDIIGKKATELLPGLNEDDFDLIQIYTKVAYGGENIKFKRYSKSLRRWFGITAYSPKKEYFVTLVEDITNEISKEQEYFRTIQLVKRQSAFIQTYNKKLSDLDGFFQHTLDRSLEIFDVTEKENAIKKIKELSDHDHLTGVYNRRYFEESFTKLNIEENQPLAIVVGDINGLRMVNNNYGIAAGDELIREAVKDIRKFIPVESILARIGGDEFIIMITKASEGDVLQLTNLLEEKLERYISIDSISNPEIYLSVSFGYAMQGQVIQGISYLIKEAESHTVRRKNYNDKSMRSSITKAMMSTLFQKSEREQRHSERVGEFCESIAKALNWNLEEINKMKVAGNLHDIGKISINEEILNKTGKLSDKEWKIMKEHSTKSGRILENVLEYEDIAVVVAAHHEKIDGTGYPKGLRGEDIPIQARIIAVADAYDAMTQYRSYKSTMSKAEAIAELYRCAATQFDSQLVGVFVNKVLLKDPFN